MGPKSWTRLAGVLIVAVGVMCFPVGWGVSPKRDLSFFNNLADLGGFVEWGMAISGAGIIILVLSIFVPPGEEE